MRQHKDSFLVDHPEILAIAVDLILHPEHRKYYSEFVLILADAAISLIKQCVLRTPTSTIPHD